MNHLTRLIKCEKGQTGTEYMVLLASVVAAIVGGAYVFNTNFKTGVSSLAGNVKTNLESGFTSSN